MHASLAEGLGFRTAHNLFAVDAGVLTQMRAEIGLAGPKTVEDGFNVVMVRPYLRAKAFNDKVRVFIQPELGTATPKLLDYELTWQPVQEFGVKIGQFLTPFSRQFLVPVPVLQFHDFARAEAKFRADRDTGVMVYGAPAKGLFEYYLGAFNGNGIDKNGNDDKSIMGIGRVAVNPVRPVAYDETPSLRGDVPFGIAIGLNGIADRAHPTKQQLNPTTGQTETIQLTPETRLTGGADLAIVYQGFSFVTEGYYKQVRPEGGKAVTSMGAYAQAGYFIIPKHFEIAARGNLVNPDTSKTKVSQRSLEVQLNGYAVGNHLKGALRYTLLSLDTPSDPFKPGLNHTFTALAQFWL